MYEQTTVHIRSIADAHLSCFQLEDIMKMLL